MSEAGRTRQPRIVQMVAGVGGVLVVFFGAEREVWVNINYMSTPPTHAGTPLLSLSRLTNCSRVSMSVLLLIFRLVIVLSSVILEGFGVANCIDSGVRDRYFCICLFVESSHCLCEPKEWDLSRPRQRQTGYICTLNKESYDFSLLLNAVLLFLRLNLLLLLVQVDLLVHLHGLMIQYNEISILHIKARQVIYRIL